ncbi:beta-N-acetylhexosaminidase [Ketobacter alkanivorans]|uniref:Beta-hexosaminidase n=1 Tax=Ketobacter alkanivorans TaxID=1917421 RepID=A0A2K9LGE4_9GAMM|nr:beta-N-acetylhexosaminidase [Ketobacter alkanivorans]AUM11456.1 beta-N-acetylhexosaminidase [Ketobacter alkanivorans]MCP5019524.1 beta-N-acetylhexosaminidase [Ketobacter sp.]
MVMGPLMLDLESTVLSKQDIKRLQHPGTGGVILFSRNIESVAQVRDLVAAVRDVRPQLLLAIDQEGGRVQRIRDGVTRLPPLARLGALYDQDTGAALVRARDWGWLMASEMLALGLDISFAPVLDLEVGRSSVIGDRSLHKDPAAVVALGRAYVAGMHEAGMAATGKHFPGHGWVEADSHVAIPVDERSLEQITSVDMQPFTQLAAEIDAVMPAHVIYTNVDQQPAGFSSFWLQTVLREQLRFNGVIFSDDLTMEGAAVAGGYAQRADAALQAGCDMVLVCNKPDGADEVLNWLETQGKQADQVRLQAMLARQRPVWEALQQSPRYQNIRQTINNPLNNLSIEESGAQ